MIEIFQRAIEEFDLYNEARLLSSITRSWYNRQLKLLTQFLAENSVNPTQITGPDILRFMATERRRGLSDRTIAARYRALRAFFKWIEANNMLDGLKSPIRPDYKPKLQTKEPKRVQLEQYELLQASIIGDHWLDTRDRLLVAVLFRCGLRVGEAAGLRLNSIDFQRKRFKISSASSKNRRDRWIPFDNQVDLLLLNYLYNRPLYIDDADALWLSDDGMGNVRGVMTKYAVLPMLRRRCVVAGLPPLNPHAFRHGFAMEMLNKGGLDMYSVSTLLGHASVKTTEEAYAKWLIDSLQHEYNEAQARITNVKRNSGKR